MNRLQDIASCMSDYDPQAMRLDVARSFIAQLATPVATVEMLPVRSALGRVLGEDIVASIDVPSYDNSAMDGYAFRSADLGSDSETTMPVAGKAFAGRAFRGEVATGSCVRIMTGAPMPAGLDTVIPQESVDVDSHGAIRMKSGVVGHGDNVRHAGEDLKRGSCALEAGRPLSPSDIGLLASLGVVEVSVFRRVRVAFFSTGSELRSIGQPLDAGCVYDSNRYTLWAMLTRLGVDVLDMGVVRDDPAALVDAFVRAAADADVIIISGGVGGGEADHTKQVMAQVGEVLFWSVALRPGRPLALGRVRSGHERSAILFGLPGNPVAVMTSFYALVRDALLLMSGSTRQRVPGAQALSTQAIRKKPGRTEYLRAIVSNGNGGRLQVSPTGPQGSGVLRSMSEANAFIVLGHEQGAVQPGDVVDVLIFDGLT